MSSFNIDAPIIEIPNGAHSSYWTIRDSFAGLSIMGGIGSSKTTGSGAFVAKRLLQNQYGGLILTVKPDEKYMWEHFCKTTGRTQDLIVLEPGGKHRFNFLDYAAKEADGRDALTDNLVDLLKTVIRAGEDKSSGKSDDPFWEDAMDTLLFHVLDLLRLAYGNVSLETMYHVIQTIPHSQEAFQQNDEPKAFQKAFEAARQQVNHQIDSWFTSLSTKQQNLLQEDAALFEAEIVATIPDARLLQFLDHFFIESYAGLSEKTRSIIDFSVSNFLFRLLREPVFSLFCRHASTVVPEDSLNGKLILVNLPVKLYQKVGRDAQVLFKYLWQLAMEKRDVRQNGRPVFLWADEAQNFLHEHDATFQATARSSRVATVYITQNLPNYYANMGGSKAEHRVKSFMGTLSTKIFHANSDIDTNVYASDLVGEGFFEDRSDSITVAREFSRTRSSSLLVDKLMRPEDFARLRQGGPANNFRTEAVLIKQGDTIHNGHHFAKMIFPQTLIP